MSTWLDQDWLALLESREDILEFQTSSKMTQFSDDWGKKSLRQQL